MSEQPQFKPGVEAFSLPLSGSNKLTLIFSHLPISADDLQRAKNFLDLIGQSLVQVEADSAVPPSRTMKAHVPSDAELQRAEIALATRQKQVWREETVTEIAKKRGLTDAV